MDYSKILIGRLPFIFIIFLFLCFVFVGSDWATEAELLRPPSVFRECCVRKGMCVLVRVFVSVLLFFVCPFFFSAAGTEIFRLGKYLPTRQPVVTPLKNTHFFVQSNVSESPLYPVLAHCPKEGHTVYIPYYVLCVVRVCSFVSIHFFPPPNILPLFTGVFFFGHACVSSPSVPSLFFSEFSKRVEDVVAIGTCGGVNGGPPFLVVRAVERSHGARAGERSSNEAPSFLRFFRTCSKRIKLLVNIPWSLHKKKLRVKFLQ